MLPYFFHARSNSLLIFMAAVTICSDFVAQENKICHCFNSLSIYLPGNDRTGCYDFIFFWMMSFKPAYSLLGMTPVQFFPCEWGLDLVRHTSSQKHRAKVMGHHFCDLPIKDQIPCIWNVLSSSPMLTMLKQTVLWGTICICSCGKELRSASGQWPAMSWDVQLMRNWMSTNTCLNLGNWLFCSEDLRCL